MLLNTANLSQLSQLPTISDTSRTTFRPLTFLCATFPSLRHRLSGGFVATCKPPLLTLAFSSFSFLDVTIYDQRSQEQLYVCSTSGAVTTVSRSRALDSESTVKVADIRWPQIPPAKNNGKRLQWTLVQMGSPPWKSGCDVLRATRHDCHKFSVVQLNQNLKWKRVGTQYQCISSDVRGPVATFEPAKDCDHPKLLIHEPLARKKKNGHPESEYNGVSLELIDHLLVTALLLVTDVQEWTLTDLAKHHNHYLPGQAAPSVHEGSDCKEDDYSSLADAVLSLRKRCAQDTSSDTTPSPIYRNSSFLTIESRSPSPPSENFDYPASPVPRIPARYRSLSTPQLSLTICQRELPSPPSVPPMATCQDDSTVQVSSTVARIGSLHSTSSHNALPFPSLHIPRLDMSSSSLEYSSMASASPSSSTYGPFSPTNRGQWRRLPHPPVHAQDKVSDGGNSRRVSPRSLPPTPRGEVCASTELRKAAEARGSIMQGKAAMQLGEWVTRPRRLSTQSAAFDPPPPAYTPLPSPICVGP